jgi:hypothetical protein
MKSSLFPFHENVFPSILVRNFIQKSETKKNKLENGKDLINFYHSLPIYKQNSIYFNVNPLSLKKKKTFLVY